MPIQPTKSADDGAAPGQRSSRLAGQDVASEHGAGDDGSGTAGAFAETTETTETAAAAAAPLLDAHAHPVAACRNGRPVGAGLRARTGIYKGAWCGGRRAANAVSVLVAKELASYRHDDGAEDGVDEWVELSAIDFCLLCVVRVCARVCM